MRKAVAMRWAGAALLPLVAGAAQAQAPAPPAAQEEEAIVVTARRVSESLQDVPASVAVFSEATLANAGIETTEDFVQLTPGVTIVTGTAEVGDTQINIRGLNGARDAEPSVALIVDGVLKTNTAALNQDHGDLTQVEILKGPQGALYGRNAAAGAIVLTTRKPGNALAGRVRLGYAEDQTFNGFASLSGPLSPGVGFVLSGDYRRTDGQFEITGPAASAGQFVDRFESYNINGRLVLDLSDRTTVDLKARYGRVDAGSIVFNAAFALPAFAGFLNNPDFFEDVNDHRFVFQPNIAPDNGQRTLEGSAKLDQDLGGGLRLSAWFSVSDINQDFLADGTSGSFGFFNQDAPCRASVAALSAAGFALPSPQFLAPTPEASVLGPYTPTLCDGTQFQVRNQRDISGELRLSGGEDTALQWQLGIYGLGLEREVGVNLGIDRGLGVIPRLFTTDPANPTEQLVHDRFNTRVYAVFGSAEWDIAETLTLSAALRYDRERRKVENLVPPGARTIYVDFNGPPFTGGAPLNPGLLTGSIDPQERTFEQVQPKISLAWKPTSEFTAFLNYGKGFKSGGFNNQGSRATLDLNFNIPLSANLAIEDSFRKETSNAFEAGIKAVFGPLTVEAAGFHTRVRDLQFFEFFVGTFGLLRVVSNIDRVNITGGELAVTLRPVRGWSIFGSGSFLGSEILENRARPDTVGNKSPYTSDYTINLGTQVEVPVSTSLQAVLRADLRIVGPTWFSTVQDQTRPTLFGVPGDYSRTQRDSYSVFNVRAALGERNGWQVALFAQNLFNEKYLEEVIPAPEFGGAFISPGARRRVGVEASWRF